MTIRLLTAYDKYPINAIVTLDAGTEAGLVAAKMASLNTNGGATYVVPVVPNQRYGAQVELDSSGAVVGLAHPNGGRFQVYGAAAPNSADGRPDGTVYIQNGFGTGTVGIFVKVAGVYKPISAAGASAVIAGTYAVGQTLTATFPTGVVGTIQFTRTLIAAPYTKSLISGAVANAVNSTTYTITSADAGYNVGIDCSNQVSSLTGGAVPAAQATVKSSGTMRLIGTQAMLAGGSPLNGSYNSAVVKLQAPGPAVGARVIVSNGSATVGMAGMKVAMATTDISACDTTDNAYKPKIAGVTNNVIATTSDKGFVKGTWNNGSTSSGRLYSSNAVLPSFGYNNQEAYLISDVIPLVPVHATDQTLERYYAILRITGYGASGTDGQAMIGGGSSSPATLMYNEYVNTNGADSPLMCIGDMSANTDAVDGNLATIPGGITGGYCPVFHIEWVYPPGIVPWTVWNVGDSIQESYKWNRWAVNRKNTNPQRPLHHCNFGGSTTRTASFAGEMMAALQVMARPDLITFPIMSVNNYSPASNFTVAAADIEFANLKEIAQFITGLGIKLCFWTPINWTANPTDPTDRSTAWNALYNSIKPWCAANGVDFMDINGDPAVSRTVYNASTNSGGWIASDNTHPSDPVGIAGFCRVYTAYLTSIGI